jgi:predicted dinucleotide-binding enzyme
VVKAFNHIYAAALTADGQPHGTSNRRAVAIAGNGAPAKAIVAKLLDEFGFDSVDIGPLKELANANACAAVSLTGHGSTSPSSMSGASASAETAYAVWQVSNDEPIRE